jgi:nickel-dependent lactate racemase
VKIMPGYPDRTLSDDDVAALTREALAAQNDFAGKRVLVIVPDGTRTAPIPLMFRLFCQELRGRATALDFLIALGTHRPMSQAQIDKLVGVSGDEWAQFADISIYNHHWEDPATFVTLGRISEDEIFEMSNGMMRKSVEVRINRLVQAYDQIIICGPVFPHEVVGFSGGNKYFFPGISGPEIIDLSHWLGALITSYATIGTKGITPMRAIINKAASMLQTPRLCFAMVVAVNSAKLHGLYIGSPEMAWAEAVELSAQVHIKYVDRPFQRVLSIMPEQYDDIWTAAKGMYKLEPVIADGGEVIIYAPHITEFSYTHGKVLAEVGYHVRDYFVKQWDRFANYPTGVLAHSTHLRGIGDYDSATGERPRIRVTLATGISAARCAAHNLGYLDPATINPEDYADREAEGVLLVRKAGEMLYRLHTSPVHVESAAAD